jgi:hypothetical protein
VPEPGLDVRTIGFYAAVASMTVWIPLPLVDGVAQNHVRRAMVREVFRRHGLAVEPETVAILADQPRGSCLGCIGSVLVWPIKKLLKWVFTFLQFKEMADIGSDVAHRALLLEEAVRQGWLPGNPKNVRNAMDRTFERLEFRPVERYLRGPFRTEDKEWREAVRAAVDGSRKLPSGGFPPGTTAAMRFSFTTQGFMAEAVHGFRAEMGPPTVMEVKSE